jgi:hypothetical protein
VLHFVNPTAARGRAVTSDRLGRHDEPPPGSEISVGAAVANESLEPNDGRIDVETATRSVC